MNGNTAQSMQENKYNFLSNGYTILNAPNKSIEVCYPKAVNADDKDFWKGTDQMVNALPYFLIQLGVMIVLIRLLLLILKPLRLPRFTAEILSGILIGPSGFGDSNTAFANYTHPLGSIEVLSVVGHLGLVYYLFLVGLDMDLIAVRHIGKKAWFSAVAGILIPIGVAGGIYCILVREKPGQSFMVALFWAISMTLTSFSDLTRVLSDIKLLHTDIGKLALSSALVNDLVTWGLFSTALVIWNGKANGYALIIPFVVFILICWFIARPALSWIISRTCSKGDEEANEHLIHVILVAVLFFGLVTDALGANAMVGAFIFGLIIPKGEIGRMIIEKIEDFVTGIMLPVFFAVNGIRLSMAELNNGARIYTLVMAITLASSAKIVSGLITSLFFGMSTREGLTLGFLMNTKGVLALIVINIARTKEGYDQQAFAMMTASFLVMTITVSLAKVAYNSRNYKLTKQYKRRTVESCRPDSGLRMLVCIHSPSNVSGMINLIEFSNPSEQSPICVFAVHLVQLTERRASAMLIIHDADYKSDSENLTLEQRQSHRIISSFQRYQSERSGSVSIQSLTAVSPYATMHEDIYGLAEDKRTTLILLPFHKQVDIDGKLHEVNTSWEAVNLHLLDRTPCSIGILVDRSLGIVQDIGKPIHLAMIFVGGPDDRDALAYARRMAGSPNVNLTVVRFLQSIEEEEEEEGEGNIMKMDEGNAMTNRLDSVTETHRQKLLDDQYTNEFRFKTMQDQSINYREKLVDGADEIIMAIGSFGPFDLYIVGRGQRVVSPLLAGVSEWSECKELGWLGDTLLNSNFAQQSSILVIQQFQ